MTTATASKKRTESVRAEGYSLPDIPKSWYEAAGMLRHKKKALEAHLKKVRNEWR
jgi:maltooligosyltrehalose synthase